MDHESDSAAASLCSLFVPDSFGCLVRLRASVCVPVCSLCCFHGSGVSSGVLEALCSNLLLFSLNVLGKWSWIMWIHWRVYSFSSLLKLHLHIYFSFIKRVTCFCIYHDRPVHWRNHTQKKGIAFAKSYASCIVGTNSPLITSRIRRKILYYQSWGWTVLISLVTWCFLPLVNWMSEDLWLDLSAEANSTYYYIVYTCKLFTIVEAKICIQICHSWILL